MSEKVLSAENQQGSGDVQKRKGEKRKYLPEGWRVLKDLEIGTLDAEGMHKGRIYIDRTGLRPELYLVALNVVVGRDGRDRVLNPCPHCMQFVAVPLRFLDNDELYFGIEGAKRILARMDKEWENHPASEDALAVLRQGRAPKEEKAEADVEAEAEEIVRVTIERMED